MKQNILRLDNIGFALPQGKTIIENISFTASSGKIIGILGPSGAGKTTLFRAISGLITPDMGQILLNENNLLKEAVSKRPISYLQQSFPLYKNLSVLENVVVAFEYLSAKEHDLSIQKAKDMLLSLGILENLWNRLPTDLSGGETQRVALAKSLLKPSLIMLLDEPFSNMDKGIKNDLIQSIPLTVKNRNIVTLYISHDENDMLLMADELIVMFDGKIVQSGNSKELQDFPSSAKVASIGSPLGLQTLTLDQFSELNTGMNLTELPSTTFKIGWRPYNSVVVSSEGLDEVEDSEKPIVIGGKIEKIIEMGFQVYYGIQVNHRANQLYLWHVENIRTDRILSLSVGMACVLKISIKKIFFLDKNDNILLKE
jgi:sulfate transport system ATP-binding protein